MERILIKLIDILNNNNYKKNHYYSIEIGKRGNQNKKVKSIVLRYKEDLSYHSMIEVKSYYQKSKKQYLLEYSKPLNGTTTWFCDNENDIVNIFTKDLFGFK